MQVTIMGTSIVVALGQHAPVIDAPASLLESEAFENLLPPPLDYTQGLQMDVTRGPIITHQFESIRSHKTVAISPIRIEAHDRSGSDDIGQSDLPQIIDAVALTLPLTDIQAVGANYEMQFRATGDQTAAEAIGVAMFHHLDRALGSDTALAGGAARLFVNAPNETLYTIAVEPRFNDRATHNIWVSCNCNVTMARMPTLDALSSIFTGGYRVVKHLVDSLFDDAGRSPS